MIPPFSRHYWRTMITVTTLPIRLPWSPETSLALAQFLSTSLQILLKCISETSAYHTPLLLSPAISLHRLRWSLSVPSHRARLCCRPRVPICARSRNYMISVIKLLVYMKRCSLNSSRIMARIVSSNVGHSVVLGNHRMDASYFPIESFHCYLPSILFSYAPMREFKMSAHFGSIACW